MLDRLLYYLDAAIALCGFDGTDEYTVFGWVVVGIASAVVIYSFYEAITKAIWPGETSLSHIKYRVLEDTQEPPHAH
mgnify:CR=1 FL=1